MNHENLRCYRQLISVADDLARRMAKWPRGTGYLCDQIRRAIASAALNVSEGNARKSRIERRRFFEISMGSIAEVSASLDLALTFGLIEQKGNDQLKSELKLAYVRIKALP